MERWEEEMEERKWEGEMGGRDGREEMGGKRWEEMDGKRGVKIMVEGRRRLVVVVTTLSLFRQARAASFNFERAY